MPDKSDQCPVFRSHKCQQSSENAVPRPERTERLNWKTPHARAHFPYSSSSSSSSLVASMLDLAGLDLAGRSAFTRAPLVPAADASPTSWPCARSSALSSGMTLRSALY